MLAGLNAETGDSFAAILPLFSNPRQADMLASRPEHLAKQAADMLRKAEESERTQKADLVGRLCSLPFRLASFNCTRRLCWQRGVAVLIRGEPFM